MARGIAEGVVGGAGTAPGMGGTNMNQRPYYSEVAGTIELSGRTWAMAEMTAPSSAGGGGAAGLLNELATQVNQPRREWVVLTNMGANVVVRQRPVDTLRDVLEVVGGGGNAGAGGEIGVFFER